MMSDQSKIDTRSKQRAKSLYFLTWRWHFYAGLFVIPFMLMLCVTGLVMLFDDEIEMARYQEILIVTPQEQIKPASVQLSSVVKAFPNYQVTQYAPGKAADHASRFSIRSQQGESLIATVNPYTAEVIGTFDRGKSIYGLMNDIHGTLLIGKWGDYLIEVSASLGILLLVSGVYLWLPRDNAAKAGFLKIRFNSGTRILMRDIHTNLGGTLSLVLLFFLISGLAWAGVWGAKMVQPWNTFPTYYTWGEKPESELTHSHLNHGSEEELPWNLEQSVLPQSHDHANMNEGEHHTMSDHAISIDDVVAKAHQLGYGYFKIFLPKSDTGVYTLAANTMAGDITDPRDDRTTHIDQYSGRLLIDVTWDDYSTFAKFMAAGTSLHQGDLSLINKVANVVFCLAFILVSITGAVMWWIRRPKGKQVLGVPPRFESNGIWKTGLVTLILLSLAFPLAGVSIVVALLLDWLVFNRVERLKLALR